MNFDLRRGFDLFTAVGKMVFQVRMNKQYLCYNSFIYNANSRIQVSTGTYEKTNKSCEWFIHNYTGS